MLQVCMKQFDREAIFAEVDASNKRFETYTEEDRILMREELRRMRDGIDKEISHEKKMI